MKTKAIIAALALLVPAALAASPRADRGSEDGESGSTARRAVSARIVYFEGEVFVDGAEAELGRELGPVSSFTTGDSAFCDVVFDGKNAVRIGKNTVATLDFRKEVYEIVVDRGGAAAVLRKLDKVAGNDSFRVRMKNATAGVRGTSFCVWDNADGSYVCACNGRVRTIDSAGGNEFDLVSAHHTAKLYVPGGKGIEAFDAEVLHHDDASVEALAARIGETIDWTTADR